MSSPAVSLRGVLDTSTVILLPRIADPSVLPTEPVITAITLAELSVGPLVTDDEQERAARQAHVQQAEADFDPLPFDAASARTFGRGRVATTSRPQTSGTCLRRDDRRDSDRERPPAVHVQAKRLRRDR
jgi:predicted nucleic acid-binding protein